MNNHNALMRAFVSHPCVHTSGFDEAEARGIFHEVNTDGSGGVGIDEFKTWWMASQRQVR